MKTRIVVVLAVGALALVAGSGVPVSRAVTANREDQSVGHFVIVCYRAKAGKEAALLELIRDHVPILRKQGLVTDRPAYVMRAKDGTIVEVFEWKSAKATDDAHSNPAVQGLWKQFGEACEYETIGNLPESKQLFSGFEAIDFPGK